MTENVPEVVNEPEAVAPPADVAAQAEPEKVEPDAPEAVEGDEPVVQEPALAEWEDDDGKKYKVAPELVRHLLREKDYTQKQQRRAEEERRLASERAEFEALRKRDADDLKVEAEIFRLSEAVKQYETVDWDRLGEEDLHRAQQEMFKLQRIRDRLAGLNEEKAKRNTQRSEALKQTTVKRMQDAEEYAAANIPGWGAEKSAELWNYAIKELGYAEHDLVQSLDARLMKLIHKSWVGDKAMAKASAPAPKKPANVEPLRTATGAGQATQKPVEKVDDMHEYVARRMKQMAASGRR